MLHMCQISQRCTGASAEHEEAGGRTCRWYRSTALKGAWPCPFFFKKEVAVKKWWAAKGQDEGGLTGRTLDLHVLMSCHGFSSYFLQMSAEVLALKGAWPCPFIERRGGGKEVVGSEGARTKGVLPDALCISTRRCPVMDPLLTFYK